MTDALTYARELIKCASITPEDKGAQDVIIKALTKIGFKSHDVKYEDVRNTFLKIGDQGPHLCFAGHTDVVPPGNEQKWSAPPFAAEIVDDEFVVGRGAADMKGNIACFMAATERYIREYGPPRGQISFLITGDEEGPGINGTRKVLEWMREEGHIPDVCLVGEPTNPEYLGQEVKIGRRGSFTGYLKVAGKQGHVAYPHKAENPLPGLVRLLEALDSTIFDRGSAYFDPSSFQILTIDVGNEVTNVIPPLGKATFNIRFNDRWSAASLEQKVRDVLNRVDVNYILKTSSNRESFLTSPGEWSHLVVDAVQNVTGHKPETTTSGGSSDAAFIHKYCPVVEFGLVNDTIHQIDEHASLNDLDMLTDVYFEVLKQYFN